MLQVNYSGGYTLDLGWYGSSNGYVLYIIKDEDWDTPVKRIQTSRWHLKEILKNAIDFIISLSEI